MQNPPQELVDRMKKKYTYENPRYNPNDLESKEPQYFKSWEINANWLILDRAIIDKEKFDGYEVIDERLTVPYKSNCSLPEVREYQTNAINKMLTYDHGVLQAPCGSGKSLMLLKIASMLGQKTLILVDEIKLILQWTQNINKFMNIHNVGIIGDGQFSVMPFTVATIQTLFKTSKYDWQKLNKSFGTVIFDECQKTPCNTAQFVINNLFAKIRIGTSATPKRVDGMQVLLWNTIGDIRHVVTDTQLKDEGKYVDYKVQPVYTGIYEQGSMWVHVVNYLVEIKERNEMIVENVVKHKDTLSLVLTNRINHAKTLQQMLLKKGVNVKLLIGEIDSEERERTRNDKRVQCIIGSSVADKGLDQKRISNIMLCTPSSNPFLLEQRIGRARRVFEGKEHAMVYDYVDKGRLVQKMWKKRQKYYNESGGIIITQEDSNHV